MRGEQEVGERGGGVGEADDKEIQMSDVHGLTPMMHVIAVYCTGGLMESTM